MIDMQGGWLARWPQGGAAGRSKRRSVMKHIGKVSVGRDARFGSIAQPDFAVSAKTDFLNAIWKAFSDFVVQKKNEVSI